MNLTVAVALWATRHASRSKAATGFLYFSESKLIHRRIEITESYFA
jgi:hypothetical protein